MKGLPGEPIGLRDVDALGDVVAVDAVVGAVDQPDLLATELVLDLPARLGDEGSEVCARSAIDDHPEHQLLGVEAIVPRLHRKDDLVLDHVARVATVAVVDLGGTRPREHPRERMTGQPGAQELLADRDPLELLPGHGSRDRLTGELQPEALGLAVVEQEVRVVDQARDAEGESPSLDLPSVRAWDSHQRVVGDHDGHTTYLVVHDLVRLDQVDRVDVGLFPYGDTEHRIALHDPARLLHRDELGLVDALDPVAGRTACANLLAGKQGAVEIEPVQRGRPPPRAQWRGVRSPGEGIRRREACVRVPLRAV